MGMETEEDSEKGNKKQNDEEGVMGSIILGGLLYGVVSKTVLTFIVVICKEFKLD